MPVEKPIRIPFDSLVLSAVVDEIQTYVGGRLQSIRQPDEHTVGLGLFAGNGRGAGEAALLLNCSPEFARAHFVARRLATLAQPSTFLATLRARIDGGSLNSARQIGGDRILELVFESDEGVHTLVAELMGKHSNLMLLDSANRVVAAAKWIPASKSSRPIVSGLSYFRPPTFDGLGRPSPFLQKLMLAGGEVLRPFSPILSPGHGAYPVSVAVLGLSERAKASMSLALEAHFELAISEYEASNLRASLLTQLGRVLLARETALSGLRHALEQGLNAGKLQLLGELVLAYGPTLPQGASVLSAWDYEGEAINVPLNPELGFKDNANLYFERAKKSKGSLGVVRDQIDRLQHDASELESMLTEVAAETRLDRLRVLQEQAKQRRWTNNQSRTGAKPKEDRPFEGHRVRELLGPGGFRILYGENAEANDYLTLRVAKPSDWWLHVRGGTSAHVVVVTQNRPERVSHETLTFAARIAVLNSPSKHSGYVSVDYTLKKYVRRPKGAAMGSVQYTHEKTLHVE